MVCAAQPWPLPSARDLAEAMRQFSSLLGSSTGSNRQLLLNREQFMSADIWLTRQLVGEGEFDRNSEVKQVITTQVMHVRVGLHSASWIFVSQSKDRWNWDSVHVQCSFHTGTVPIKLGLLHEWSVFFCYHL